MSGIAPQLSELAAAGLLLVFAPLIWVLTEIPLLPRRGGGLRKASLSAKSPNKMFQ